MFPFCFEKIVSSFHYPQLSFIVVCAAWLSLSQLLFFPQYGIGYYWYLVLFFLLSLNPILHYIDETYVVSKTIIIWHTSVGLEFNMLNLSQGSRIVILILKIEVIYLHVWVKKKKKKRKRERERSCALQTEACRIHYNGKGDQRVQFSWKSMIVSKSYLVNETGKLVWKDIMHYENEEITCGSLT